MRTSKIYMVGAVALAGVAVSSANAQIAGSAHDFTALGWATNEICRPCHTPHFANRDGIVGDLWNHENSVATFTLFGGASGTPAADFDSKSRLCLGCHDGTVALDSFGGQTGTTYIAASADLGTDLSNDHPVGSQGIYPTMPSTRFNDPTTFPSAVKLRTWVDGLGVPQTVVGCTTCHNQHNKGNFTYMLQISNTGSALCLTCHIK